ncbi:MAG: hypothetical protein AAFQ82_20955, partial [Myxococcota bacterium]
MSREEKTAVDGRRPEALDAAETQADPRPSDSHSAPQAAVHAALAKARKGVERSERLTAQRQALQSVAQRFARFTQMAPKARPKLSQVFGSRIGRPKRNGVFIGALGLAVLLALALALSGTSSGSGADAAQKKLVDSSVRELAEAVDSAGVWSRWGDRTGALLAADAVVFRYGDA